MKNITPYLLLIISVLIIQSYSNREPAKKAALVDYFADNPGGAQRPPVIAEWQLYAPE